METYISLLRGINVGGKNPIKMADLKELYQQIGFSNTVSYIQSGNLIFRHKKTSTQLLAGKIQTHIFKERSMNIAVIVMHKKELEQIIHDNPFLLTKPKDSLYISFFDRIPSIADIDTLKNVNAEPDEFHWRENIIYLSCHKGYSDTKLSNKLFESKLKLLSTTRNLNTCQEILRLAAYDY